MKRKTPTYRDCIVCGAQFEIGRPQDGLPPGSTKTCSPECSAEHDLRWRREWHAENRDHIAARVSKSSKARRANNPESAALERERWRRGQAARRARLREAES